MWLQRRSFFLLVLCVLPWLGLACGTSAPSERDFQHLITDAGNAKDDTTCLAILKRLQTQTDLDPQLQSDVEHMVAAVDRWVNYPWLNDLGQKYRHSTDYSFHIGRDSPLYPLACYYRARMLVAVVLEGARGERRKQWLEQAVADFQIARSAFPQNHTIRMYLGEPILAQKQYSAPSDIPAWAVYQRESLERLTDIIVWWIDNRLQRDGKYGGNWGDDCEMWRWWAPVLVGFADPKISAAQYRFSSAILRRRFMRDGYFSKNTDVEHSAEYTADAITPMMQIARDDAFWKDRATDLADLMRDRWTGVNRRGFLQFRSTYFTAAAVDSRPDRACDTAYHPRAVQPALLLWQRTRDEDLGRLFSAWMDTWVDAAARSERGKPAGVLPSAIHWPEGCVGGVSDDWWDPCIDRESGLYVWPSGQSMLCETLLLTYYVTRDERYLQPLRSMASIRRRYLKHPPHDKPKPGGEAWCAERLGFLANTLAKYRVLTGNTEFDGLLADESALPVTDGMSFVDELKGTAQALRMNFPGYTSEVRYTDRVLKFPMLFKPGMLFADGVSDIQQPNPMFLYSTVTGDPGRLGYFPLNAVRWLTQPRDIAALVTDADQHQFKAELVHFGSRPRRMAAELYLLAPGVYILTCAVAPDRNEKVVVLERQDIAVRDAVTRVSFCLPPKKHVVFRIDSAGRTESRK